MMYLTDGENRHAPHCPGEPVKRIAGLGALPGSQVESAFGARITSSRSPDVAQATCRSEGADSFPSTTPARLPWETLGAAPDPDDYKWELYNLTDDFSEAKDIAKENPQKLLDMQSRFLIEAVKHNVLPLDSSFADRMDPSIRPNLLRGQTDFTYYPGMIRIPEANSPDVHNKSFRITANVEIPQGGADGVLATQGGRFGGWSLLVLDEKRVPGAQPVQEWDTSPS